MLVGGYLQGKIKLNNNKIQIESGIRTSYFDVTKETYFEPRASVVINPSDKLSFKELMENIISLLIGLLERILHLEVEILDSFKWGKYSC